MRVLDTRMVNYIDRYKKARNKLQNQCSNIHKEFKGINPFEIIHKFTHEENAEYERLCKESKERLYARSEG